MDATSTLSFSATHLVVLDAIDPKIEESTAASLVENLRARFAGAHKALITEIIEIPDRRTFDTALARVLELAEEGALPMIHFDGHADVDGLRSANGDVYLWRTMWAYLTRINIRCRNNLCITMGVCMGLHSILDGAFSIMRPAPAFVVVAAQNKVSADAVAAGFELYFEKLMVTGNVTAAFEELKAVDDQKPGGYHGDFQLRTSQFLFEKSAFKYLKEKCFGKGGLERVNQLIADSGFVGPAMRKARKLLRGKVRDSQALALSRYYEHFMMVDLYPELRPRLATDWVKFENDAREAVLKQKRRS